MVTSWGHDTLPSGSSPASEVKEAATFSSGGAPPSRRARSAWSYRPRSAAAGPSSGPQTVTEGHVDLHRRVAVQRRAPLSRGTVQACWSSLNRSGRPGPALLQRM